MKTLADGERFIRCVIGEKTDRVPYGVGLGWVPWPATLERWKAESGMAEIDLREIFGFDYRDAVPPYHQGYFPPFEVEVIEERGEFVVSRNERGITLRNRRDLASMPEFLDYPVKTPEDWERLKAERLDPATPGRLAGDWGEFRARIGETGEAVAVGEFPFGVFGFPREMMGAEEFLIAFHTDPALVKDMMEHLTTLWITLWEKIADEVQIDRVHIWEDMSGRQGSLISPKMVEEFMMPCYDRIAAFAKEAGVRVISVDTDGDVGELVPIFAGHGVNLIYPFEVQAGNDIFEYRRRYPTLGILGGLDKRALARGRREIDAEIERAREMVRYGRYVPGFDHLIPPDVPWENFRYAAERMREVCFGETGRD
ncbi:MAG: uroporphyrinogen decarboxylase family protein [Planctomycetota bacterium]